VNSTELVALVCCDLGAIVRGRSVFASDVDRLAAGVGWVPANHSLTPHGPLARETPFDSTGDLRLVPDLKTLVRVEGRAENTLDLVLCDIVETDGTPWECCPRHFLRTALAALEAETGALAKVSFEHEFQLLRGAGLAPAGASPDPTAPAAAPAPDPAPAPACPGPPPAPFSLEALRRAEPFAAEAMKALVEAGVKPERIFAEFAAHQFEIPVAAAEGLEAADRAVLFREVVREVARRNGLCACFSPLLDPSDAGNGVHIHLNLTTADGTPLLYDPSRPASLSPFGGSFAAGILRRAGALNALTAPSPVSSARLVPHRWSAGAVCLGARNRETLLRIPSLVPLAAAEPAEQFHIEYRGADAAANPYIALGAILHAGLEGVREGLQTPPILEGDPSRLDAAEAERYGVDALPKSLSEALGALAEDEAARGWFGPTLYEAYVGVKRAEVEATADLDLAEVCRRYASIY
jgi:glutamine synthetase